MRNWKRLGVCVVVALIVGSCVRTSVDRVTGDTAIIEGRGSAFNDSGDVQREMLKTAADETLAAGYDFFAIEGGNSGYSQSIVNTAPGVYQGTTTGSLYNYGNYYSGSATTYGTYTPPQYATISKPRGSLQIRMFRGQPPASVAGVYDARKVLREYAAITGEPVSVAAATPAPTPPPAPTTASLGAVPSEYRNRDDLDRALVSWCTVHDTPTNCGCFQREAAQGPNALADPEMYQLLVWMKVIPGEPLANVYPNQTKINGALGACGIQPQG